MNRVLESLLCPTSGNSVVYRTFVLWRYVRYRDGDHSALPSIRYAFLPRCFPQMMCFRLLNTKWQYLESNSCFVLTPLDVTWADCAYEEPSGKRNFCSLTTLPGFDNAQDPCSGGCFPPFLCFGAAKLLTLPRQFHCLNGSYPFLR